jgi:hypothetical protein
MKPNMRCTGEAEESFIPILGTRWKWVVTVSGSNRFIPREKDHCYSIRRRRVVPTGDLNLLARRNMWHLPWNKLGSSKL